MISKEYADANTQEYLGRDVFVNSNDDIAINTKNDLTTVRYDNNLVQSVVNRLRTQIGELPEHPDYGSRLNELIGTNANELTLSTAKMYVRAALLQEPRIEEILEIRPSFRENTANQVIDIYIQISPIGGYVELDLIYSVFI